MSDYRKEQDLIFQQIADMEKAAAAEEKRQRLSGLLIEFVSKNGDAAALERLRETLLLAATKIKGLSKREAEAWADAQLETTLEMLRNGTHR